jgi:hypothetical protein
VFFHGLIFLLQGSISKANAAIGFWGTWGVLTEFNLRVAKGEVLVKIKNTDNQSNKQLLNKYSLLG